MSHAKRNATPRSEKRQFLVHLDAALIRRVKVLAIDRNVSASSLVQDALLAYLSPSAGAPSPAPSAAPQPATVSGDPS